MADVNLAPSRGEARRFRAAEVAREGKSAARAAWRGQAKSFTTARKIIDDATRANTIVDITKKGGDRYMAKKAKKSAKKSKKTTKRK